MSNLTTVANVKQWLNITTDTDDPVLERLVAAASAFIQTWTNRVFASATYNETCDGNGGAVMMFSNYPVTAVSALTIDGVAIPVAPSTFANGYRFDAQRVFLNGYKFCRGIGNVVVAYTAGYATTPPEIEQACIELIGLRYKERDRIGHVSKSIGGETVAFTQKDMPDDVRTILQNYKKVIPL